MVKVIPGFRFLFATFVLSVFFSASQRHPFRVQTICSLLSGGLRYATTTGYYLAALQAGEQNNAKELLELW
jgi:zinc transporter ZupT